MPKELCGLQSTKVGKGSSYKIHFLVLFPLDNRAGVQCVISTSWTRHGKIVGLMENLYWPERKCPEDYGQEGEVDVQINLV